jgi:hypothetical protein
MSHDKTGHCFFARQPNTEEEIDAAILSVWVSCCGAVRYGGQDREILIRLTEMGSADCCDYRLDSEPKPLNVSHVSFEFVEAEVQKTGPDAARQIMEYFVGSLRTRNGQVLDFRCSGITSSFRYEWGHSLQSGPYSVTFILEPHGERYWLLRILRPDSPSTAFAIGIHKALGHDERFRRVQWFTEEEWKKNAVTGRTRPF